MLFSLFPIIQEYPLLIIFLLIILQYFIINIFAFFYFAIKFFFKLRNKDQDYVRLSYIFCTKKSFLEKIKLYFILFYFFIPNFIFFKNKLSTINKFAFYIVIIYSSSTFTLIFFIIYITLLVMYIQNYIISKIYDESNFVRDLFKKIFFNRSFFNSGLVIYNSKFVINDAMFVIEFFYGEKSTRKNNLFCDIFIMVSPFLLRLFYKLYIDTDYLSIYENSNLKFSWLDLLFRAKSEFTLVSSGNCLFDFFIALCYDLHVAIFFTIIFLIIFFQKKE